MQDKQLASIIEPILASRGLELDSLDITPVGKRSILRITVDGDGPKGRGPLLDDIASASSAISVALDESTATGNAPYTLEVSSRGVSKPLTEAKHFRRNVGRLVKLNLAEGDVSGRIQAAGDDTVSLDVDGTARDIAIADIKKAVVQVELNRSMDDEGEDD